MFVDFDRLSSAVWVSVLIVHWLSLLARCRSCVPYLFLFFFINKKKSKNTAHCRTGSLWAEFIYECTRRVRSRVRLRLVTTVTSHFSHSTALLISVWFECYRFNGADYAHLSPASHDFTPIISHSHFPLVTELLSAPLHSRLKYMEKDLEFSIGFFPVDGFSTTSALARCDVGLQASPCIHLKVQYVQISVQNNHNFTEIIIRMHSFDLKTFTFTTRAFSRHICLTNSNSYSDSGGCHARCWSAHQEQFLGSVSWPRTLQHADQGKRNSDTLLTRCWLYPWATANVCVRYLLHIAR